MRIAFVIENVPRRYSGGRVHGWLIIEALLALGHAVFVYTEGLPPFYDAMCKLAGKPVVRRQMPLKNLRITDPVDLVCSFPILATPWAHREARRLHVDHAAWVLDPKLLCSRYAPAVAGRMQYSNAYRFALRNAKLLIASNETAAPYVRKWTGNKEVEPWTPSINSVVADEQKGGKRDGGRAVAVTRMTEHKNARDVLQAVRAAGCCLDVITSFDAGAIRGLARTMGIGGKVAVWDTPDDAQKFRLFWGASVFLSGSQYEGLGIPQMEALYCGCRPVVYDFGVMREICGPVGEYAKWRDPVDLGRALMRGLRNPMRSRVLEAGQRYAFDAMLKRAPWILQ